MNRPPASPGWREPCAARNLPCTLLDANLEGQLFLLSAQAAPADTWGRRACRNLTANLAALRAPDLYAKPARYRRAVADVNRVLELAGQTRDISLSLANYQDPNLSPLEKRRPAAGGCPA